MNRLKPIHYSDESDLLLNRIFYLTNEGKKSFGNIECKTTIFTKGKHYDSIPAEIRKEIDTFSHFYVSKFPMGERHIEIFFSSFTGISKAKLRTYLRKIYVWLYVACGFAAVNACSRTLKIFIYMTKQKKEFPALRGEVLGIPHVNAGFTYSCIPSNEIHVYREEEWFKVVIHETFHSLHLDFSSMSEKIANPLLSDIIPLGGGGGRGGDGGGRGLDFRFYEAYTDGWADIIHTVFISNGSIARFKKNMEIERRFTLYQCARVLHHYNLSYADLFDKDSNYKENSPVLSYYIIKSCFHYFLDDFLKWCAITNRGSIQFRHTEGTVKSFFALYKSLYRNSSYMTYLEDVIVEKLFLSKGKMTLRRTILE